MQHILAGRRLPQPTEEQCGGAKMSYGLYSLTSRCMEGQASARPTMRQIVEYWGVDVVVTPLAASGPEVSSKMLTKTPLIAFR